VYQLMQFFLALVGAPMAHKVIKWTGFISTSE